MQHPQWLDLYRAKSLDDIRRLVRRSRLPSDPNADPAANLTPERIQAVLDARNRHVPNFINMVYGDAPKLHHTIITKNLQNFQSQVLRSRPLTDDEIGALADHWSASANIALTAKPFPKWVNTSPDVFPTISRPMLQGKAARIAWHTARFGVYAVMCNWFVTPFFLSYAGVRATVSISSDPRLQEAVKESNEDQEGEHSTESSDSWGGRTSDSPQASRFSETGHSQTTRDAPQERASQPDPYTYQPRRSAAAAAAAPSEPSSWDKDSVLEELEGSDEEDNASPGAPPRSPPSDDGVSAWDRLRERAQAEKNDDEPTRRR
ncbi:unnamed protein product [Parascedosporium putredinis]|uniref:Uncharacterized protein n=1 Tax=Parascedosporium putredinis TaxID=1442378 RepID=A0A9P1MGI5_9PEZI|nr:unnamed protein product [Parascedosporium putredinis]CAI8004555.1 unnamed protein product [Parascedosporium putredinis]